MPSSSDSSVNEYFRNSTHSVTKTPTVLQMEALECGAAALAMVLGYFGHHVPLDQLRVECGVSTAGTNAAAVMRTAKKHGLKCRGFRRELSDLKEQKFPAILFWNFNHFVVLEGIKRNRVYLNDPADGRKTVSWEDFDAAFTGILLEFEAGEDFVKQKKQKTFLTSVKNHLKGRRDLLLYTGAMSFLIFLAGFVTPAFSRFFTDQILVQKMTGFFKPLLFAMAINAILTAILSWFNSLVELRFSVSIAIKESSAFLNKLFRLPIEFFVQRLPGELCQRMGTAEAISQFLSSQAVSIAVNLFAFILYTVIMFMYDVTLTLISLAFALICIISYNATKDRYKSASMKNLQDCSKLGGQIMMGLSIIETLKSCGSENDFFNKYAGQQAKYSLSMQEMARLSMYTSLVPAVAGQILGVLLLIVGSFKIISGEFTLGMLMAFQAMQSSFMGIINTFFGLTQTIHTTNAELNRIDDVMEYPDVKRFKETQEEGTEEEETEEDFEKLGGTVELKNISFGYSHNQPALINDLNISLKPGSRIALVGMSGSGKSTIGKLVASLYEPWSGEILFDGKPLSEITRAQYTASVSAVDQDIFLFEGTVKDNLTMWDDSIPEEDYINAAKDACIHDVITERAGGYYSNVTEDGGNFSGGQRQRLEIARALCRNPNVLILDEATSALDPITELEIDKNLRKRGCSCIIIAHRLSTIRDADEIIVLDNGKIIERGTHDELMEKGGRYSLMVRIM